MLKVFKKDNRPIFYLDETWVDRNLIFKKCWQNYQVAGITTSVSGSNQFIVAHIGSKAGVLDGSELIFRAGTVKGNYHREINRYNFENG